MQKMIDLTGNWIEEGADELVKTHTLPLFLLVLEQEGIKFRGTAIAVKIIEHAEMYDGQKVEGTSFELSGEALNDEYISLDLRRTEEGGIRDIRFCLRIVSNGEGMEGHCRYPNTEQKRRELRTATFIRLRSNS